MKRSAETPEGLLSRIYTGHQGDSCVTREKVFLRNPCSGPKETR